MAVELGIDSRHFARDLGVATLLVSASVSIVYLFVKSLLAAVISAVVVLPLAAYTVYIWRAGWLGVRLEDGLLRVRYVSCILVREATLRPRRITVRLVWRGDPLWPMLRLCGFYFFSGFGLFMSRDRTRYYALIGHDCRGKAVYLEADGLRLFICTESGEVDELVKMLSSTTEGA